jgi:hypothetical protein
LLFSNAILNLLQALKQYIMNKRYLLFVFILIAAACSTPKETISEKKPVAKLEDAPEGYVYHQVLRGETIFGIIQKYNLSVEAAKELNKEVGGVITAGQILKIHVGGEKKEAKKKVETPSSNTTSVNISFLLPFNANMSIDTLTDGDEIEEKSAFKSTVAVEFYEGALLALDSLKKQGFNANVNVLDTQDDSLVLKRLLYKKEVKESNLIIGPFANAQLACANTFSLLQHAVLVSPLSSLPSKLVLQNPYANIAVPSVNIQCRQMASFVADNFPKANIIVSHGAKGAGADYAVIFRNIIAQKLNGKVTDINVTDAGTKSIYNSMSSSQNNVIIVTSSNEAFITELLTGLNSRKDKYKITLIGLPTWDNFETIDMDLMQNLNTYIFKAYFVDEENADVIQFRKKYVANYKTEPSSYVYQGFDLMYYYGKLIMKNGKKIIENVPQFKLNTMHTSYMFDAETPGKGYENQYISVLKFQDYKLVKVNK